MTVALALVSAIALASHPASRLPRAAICMKDTPKAKAKAVEPPPSTTPLPPPPATAPPAPPPPPVVEGTSPEGLKTIALSRGDSSAVVYTYGACVTSYKQGGTEFLKIRPDAKMDGSKPISGGIPICAPQFGPGAIQQHGFARNLEWEVVKTESSPDPSVELKLVDSEETRAMWPFPFEWHYTVVLGKDMCAPRAAVGAAGRPHTLAAPAHRPPAPCAPQAPN